MNWVGDTLEKRYLILPAMLAILFFSVAGVNADSWSKEYTFNTATTYTVPESYDPPYVSNVLKVEIFKLESYDFLSWIGSWFGLSEPGIEGRVYVETNDSLKYYLDCSRAPNFTDFDIQLGESAYCELDDVYLKRYFGYSPDSDDVIVLTATFVKAAGDKLTIKLDVAENFLNKAKVSLAPGNSTSPPNSAVPGAKTGDITLEFAGYESILQGAGFSNPWAAIKGHVKVYEKDNPSKTIVVEYIDDKTEKSNNKS